MTTTREDLEAAWTEVEKKRQFAREAAQRAKELRIAVEKSSAPDTRVWQTLNHLAGKEVGDAADASIRHRENIKESMAEDAEEGNRRLRKEASDLQLLIDTPPRKKAKK